MAAIAERIKLFNRAFFVAWEELKGDHMEDRSYAAQCLTELIKAELNEGSVDPEGIARKVLVKVRSELSSRKNISGA